MSQKIYCPSCAAPNLYIGSKPKFCNFCSSSFDLAKFIPDQPKKTKTKEAAYQRLSDDDDDDRQKESSASFDFSNFKINAEIIPSEGGVVKFGDLIKMKKDAEFGANRQRSTNSDLDQVRNELFGKKRSEASYE